jgi:ABC-type transport system involved in multi-copper enzyme maturation permease subunit
MLWTIMKRELADHLLTFRFAAVFILVLVLLLGSALVNTAAYRREVREIPRRVDQLVDENGRVDLGAVACQGEATVRRRPSRLAFVSGTGSRELPNEAVMAVHGLRAVQRTADLGEILARPTDLDWTRIIATLLGFAAGLLTYKSVSGERRDGTLALLLSQPVSRSTVLLGKYLAAVIILAAGLAAAMLFSLLALHVLHAAPLAGDDGLKIGLFGIVSLVYLSLFVLIGLICSVLGRSPLLSAAGFLFVWAGLVFLVPSLGGVLAGRMGKIMTPLQVRELAATAQDRYSPGPGMNDDETAAVKLQREMAREQVLLSYVRELIGQVRLGQNLTRTSPAAVYALAAERILGEGTFQLERFVDNAVRYREGFLAAVLEADRRDPESRHRYVPWWCDNPSFSRNTVEIGPAGEFRDPLPSSGEGLVAAAGDILLLLVDNLIAFAAAFWLFARRSVTPAPGV